MATKLLTNDEALRYVRDFGYKRSKIKVAGRENANSPIVFSRTCTETVAHICRCMLFVITIRHRVTLQH